MSLSIEIKGADKLMEQLSKMDGAGQRSAMRSLYKWGQDTMAEAKRRTPVAPDEEHGLAPPARCVIQVRSSRLMKRMAKRFSCVSASVARPALTQRFSTSVWISSTPRVRRSFWRARSTTGSACSAINLASSSLTNLRIRSDGGQLATG